RPRNYWLLRWSGPGRPDGRNPAGGRRTRALNFGHRMVPVPRPPAAADTPAPMRRPAPRPAIQAGNARSSVRRDGRHDISGQAGRFRGAAPAALVTAGGGGAAVARGVTLRPWLTVTAVVGCVLSAINEGARIAAGHTE